MSKQIPTPKPETINAIIPNVMGKPTLHVFLETRECNEDGPAYEFIYQCTETETERRWGIVERYEIEGN